MDIGVRIIGERRVALRFERFPEFAREELTKAVTALQQKLFEAIQAQIPKKSGRLAATMTGGVESNPSKVRGWVNVAGKDRNLILQAMALEYGSNSAVSVKALASRTVRTVYGKQFGPVQAAISAYTRQSDIVAQRFMRGPLAEMADGAVDEMQDAFDRAVDKANAQ